MKLNEKQYLGLESDAVDFDRSGVVVIPFGYEGGVSYGKGTAYGPQAIIDASCHLELYDVVLGLEPASAGICTVAQPDIPHDPQRMANTVYENIKALLDQNKFVVAIGGDHSISGGFCKAVAEKYKRFSVIQLDAHADLRHEYEGSIYSHASVMARIREMTTHTMQIGIRSMSIEEAQLVKEENITLYTMDRLRRGQFDLTAALIALPDPLFITFDLDVFDWSVIRSTGTPEPGGLLWDEALDLLNSIFSVKNVIGFDVVELSHNEQDPNSAFAAAKLIYKMIGMKFFGDSR